MSSQNRAQKSSCPVAVPTNVIAQYLSHRATGTDSPSEALEMGERLTHFREDFDGSRGLCHATANKLTDNALLDIFEFYLKDNGANDGPYQVRLFDKWHTLVHVCRKWRDVVFASPRRLNLRLLCRNDRPVREMLDNWPALPIVIDYNWVRSSDVGLEDIIAALEHPDRVCAINFCDFSSSAGEALAAAMQVPFPELTHLVLWPEDKSSPILPDSFLGGSAPRLRTLRLTCIPFPAVPNLFLSATDLVDLSLSRLPHSGYISPGSMVACLSSLNRLESLDLGFESPQSRPDQPSPPPQTRVVLSALTELSFVGMIDYSEDFLARIDTPVLDQLSMSFFLDLVFDVPRLTECIGRAKILKSSKAVTVRFQYFPSRTVQLGLDNQHGSILEVRCDRIDWQVDSMALICGQLSPFFSHIERLDVVADYWPFKFQGEDDVESAQIFELFQPFAGIRTLHVSKRLVSLVTRALQELSGERATEVLPNLRDLFLGGSEVFETVPEAMQPFVTARQLFGQPVAIHH